MESDKTVEVRLRVSQNTDPGTLVRKILNEIPEVKGIVELDLLGVPFQPILKPGVTWDSWEERPSTGGTGVRRREGGMPIE
jgi:hypothetical protein